MSPCTPSRFVASSGRSLSRVSLYLYHTSTPPLVTTVRNVNLSRFRSRTCLTPLASWASGQASASGRPIRPAPGSSGAAWASWGEPSRKVMSSAGETDRTIVWDEARMACT